MLLDVYDTISWIIGGITLAIALIVLTISIISLVKTKREANKQIEDLQKQIKNDEKK